MGGGRASGMRRSDSDADGRTCRHTICIEKEEKRKQRGTSTSKASLGLLNDEQEGPGADEV